MSAATVLNLPLAAIAAVLSCGLVGLVRHYALRKAILDHPSDRSSHTVPTPRGGGLGLVVALLIAVGVTALDGRITAQLALALGGIIVTAVVGWMDDHRGVVVGARLATHLAASATLLPLAVSPEPVPAWLGQGAVLWWLFWTVSAINVVNFMDGIDGLIGLQALVFGTYLLVLGSEGGFARAFGAALAGASLGFLLWNWAPARIFLGDVGSGALGIAMVLGGLLLMREGRVGVVVAYLPLYPIFLDATVTIVRRARRGEPLTVAHRSHLYQQLANGGWGHARVAAFYGCLAALALPIARLEKPLQGVTFVGYFVLIAVLGWWLEYRLRSAQG